MKILIYGLNYAPEITGVGKYTSEMAEWFAQAGHHVKVVTAPPYYPKWRILPPYKNCWTQEIVAGIRVYRSPLWVPAQPSALKRLIHLMSFAVSSFPVMAWQTFRFRPNIVCLLAPTIFCLPGAWVATRLTRGKLWLHIQDFELDAAQGLGLLASGGILTKLTAGIERKLLQGADVITTISEQMYQRLVSKKVAGPYTWLFPNWVDTALIYPLDAPSPLRQAWGIPEDAFVALYSGSLGEKQGLDIILEAAKLLIEQPKIQFIICGEGFPKQRLMQLAQEQGLSNILFQDLQPLEALNDLLNIANVHLLPQRADVADTVLPSKLKGMFASGQPVIATAHSGTQLERYVSHGGLVIAPENPTLLAQALQQLFHHPEYCQQLGQKARQFALQAWHQENVLKAMETKLIEITLDHPNQKIIKLASTNSNVPRNHR
ncbi:WcaI family glycosyltransferase [Synechococcus sp. PCC 6312]|uniref:WcaI family glycosyltransferase n=1 Tax=Synechococcus sp. (strain ATCC 27167 / PCC 6312) TaxID=195253 RepID=UPI00029EE917|nr:WcaI family glycosyltransferase [Synechococcus sp. PCC 6312]AFY62428.1 glycosyltransferase [Synechococcus sp. PCC 6312]